MLTEMHSGVLFNLAQPVASEVSMQDVAHHLSNICRFNGGTDSFYSVAEHSIMVQACLAHRGASTRLQMAGLLHDAHEAYVGDIITPVKKMLGKRYRDIVRNIDYAVCEKFGVTYDDLHAHEVWECDQIMLSVEAQYMMCSAGEGEPWNLMQVTRLEQSLLRPQRMNPSVAKERFLATYNKLLAKELKPGQSYAV